MFDVMLEFVRTTKTYANIGKVFACGREGCRNGTHIGI